jgi:hypothetical protein
MPAREKIVFKSKNLMIQDWLITLPFSNYTFPELIIYHITTLAMPIAWYRLTSKRMFMASVYLGIS